MALGITAASGRGLLKASRKVYANTPEPKSRQMGAMPVKISVKRHQDLHRLKSFHSRPHTMRILVIKSANQHRHSGRSLRRPGIQVMIETVG